MQNIMANQEKLQIDVDHTIDPNASPLDVMRMKLPDQYSTVPNGMMQNVYNLPQVPSIDYEKLYKQQALEMQQLKNKQAQSQPNNTNVQQQQSSVPQQQKSPSSYQERFSQQYPQQTQQIPQTNQNNYQTQQYKPTPYHLHKSGEVTYVRPTEEQMKSFKSVVTVYNGSNLFLTKNPGQIINTGRKLVTFKGNSIDKFQNEKEKSSEVISQYGMWAVSQSVSAWIKLYMNELDPSTVEDYMGTCIYQATVRYMGSKDLELMEELYTKLVKEREDQKLEFQKNQTKLTYDENLIKGCFFYVAFVKFMKLAAPNTMITWRALIDARGVDSWFALTSTRDNLNKDPHFNVTYSLKGPMISGLDRNIADIIVTSQCAGIKWIMDLPNVPMVADELKPGTAFHYNMRHKACVKFYKIMDPNILNGSNLPVEVQGKRKGMIIGLYNQLFGTKLKNLNMTVEDRKEYRLQMKGIRQMFEKKKDTLLKSVKRTVKREAISIPDDPVSELNSIYDDMWINN